MGSVIIFTIKTSETPAPTPLLPTLSSDTYTVCGPSPHVPAPPTPPLPQTATPLLLTGSLGVPTTGTVPQIQRRGRYGPRRHSGLFSQVPREWCRRAAQALDSHITQASWTPHPLRMGMARGGTELPFLQWKGHMPEELCFVARGAGRLLVMSQYHSIFHSSTGGKAWRSCSS